MSNDIAFLLEDVIRLNPGIEILPWFRFNHLPAHLQATSKRFANLAIELARLPSSAERSMSLRKLLEAKDAAVRATAVTDPKPGTN